MSHPPSSSLMAVEPVAIESLSTLNPFDTPLLVRFPHGPPSSLQSPSTVDSFYFSLFSNTHTKRESQRLLLASQGIINYLGKNYAEQNHKYNATKYAIGVVDNNDNNDDDNDGSERGAKRMRLIAVNHIYKMEQHVPRSAPLHPSDSSSTATAASASSSRAEDRRRMIEEFGSLKARRALRSALASQVVIQADTEAVLSASVQPNTGKNIELIGESNGEGAMEEESIDNDAALQLEVARKILPPFDEKTDDVKLIYSIYNIVSPEEWEHIDWKTLHSLVKNGIKVLDLQSIRDNYGEFIASRLGKISLIDNKTEQKLECRKLEYLKYLIQFRKLPKKNKYGGLRNNIPVQEVAQRFLNEFTELSNNNNNNSNNNNNNNDKPKASTNKLLEDKLLCWILVTSLLCSDYSIEGAELEGLAVDLSLQPSDLIKYFREIGCTNASKTKASLTAPLKLPRLKTGGKAKKGRR